MRFAPAALAALILVAVAPAWADAIPPAATRHDGESGYLTVESIPPARVFLDGRDSGRDTPIVARQKLPLAPGAHQLLLVTRDGRTATVEVTIRAGEVSAIHRAFDEAPAEASIAIALDRRGAIFVGERAMSEAELLDYVKDRAGASANIAADGETPFRLIIHLIDLLKAHGVRKFTFATAPAGR